MTLFITDGRSNRRISRAVSVAALFTGLCLAEKIEVDLVPETMVKNRLTRGEVRHKERQAAIQDLFSEAGCSVEEQRIDRSSANVICTLPGQTSSTIVVGGHFDFVDRGKGMVDDWSGTSLLPSLYQSLKSRPRPAHICLCGVSR
jgi:hypothetical protein